MATTLIIPGLDGAGPGHWQDWWLRNDPNAVLVAQRGWRAPSPEAWGARLAAAVHEHPYAWLVAHGAGALMVARVAAERLELRIAGALLVTPSDPEAPEAGVRLQPFAPVSLAPLPFPATLVASRTDPRLRFRRARTLAAAWGARLVDYGDAGHVNPAAGFGPWPDGPRLLAEAQAPGRRAAGRQPLRSCG